ncbi:MAG: hypothetical protein JWN04_6303 [Myxococcaceae bacterium]|nr:hypothetical protein [Myxococcaceae bacterium]
MQTLLRSPLSVRAAGALPYALALALAGLLGCHDTASHADRDAAAAPVVLRLVSYNVAGLPEGISSSHPSVNSALISPLLNAYSLALLQEDFSYHADIISMTKHAYSAPVDRTQQGLGDGLSFLSDYPFSDFERVPWSDCFGVTDSGSDCLTPKGFSFTRLELAAGISVDVYDVHADAGSAAGDQAARAKNLRQLAAAINLRSAGRAVVVAGDTNARYSKVGDNVGELVDAANLTDVWVEQVNGGARPMPGAAVPCSSTDENDPKCERIDKLFYRNATDGSGVTLQPSDYTVEGASFVDARGAQLSDHLPVAVTFRLTAQAKK